MLNIKKVGFLSILLSCSMTVSADSKVQEELSSFQEQISELHAESRDLNDRISQITRALHYYKNSPTSLTSLISGSKKNHKRKMKENILNDSLALMLEEKNELSAKQSELMSQIHLIEINKEYTRTTKNKRKSKRSRLSCKVWPLSSENPLLLRNFGEVKDSETKISWDHPGWLFQAEQTPIVACEQGRVVFSGKIDGRGNVVVIDHNAGYIATYAHITPNESLPQKGDLIKAGQVLGIGDERFYFEIRENGIATNPRKVFSKKFSKKIKSIQ